MKNYNVLTDFHHSGLLNSLIMLFEDRLGGNLYRPIGEDWFSEGFWALYDHPETVKQYLTLDQGYRPVDGTPPLNMIAEVEQPQFGQENVYYCRDIESHKLNKAITLETFKSLPIDIVIASVPQHIEPFKRLIAQYKPGAKLIFQIGNNWEPTDVIDNIMASALIPMDNVPNKVVYHQEFDVNLFKPRPEYQPKTIYSFINVYSASTDWPLFTEVERTMPLWDFKSFGGQCRDGAMHGTRQLAAKMQEAQFIWHAKPGGDGYGHVLFNAAACGKPMIVKKVYYYGKLGEKLLIDGVTCIDMDNKPLDQIVYEIEYYSDPARYAAMSHNVAENFKSQVDFDAEFEQIKVFLENLR